MPRKEGRTPNIFLKRYGWVALFCLFLFGDIGWAEGEEIICPQITQSPVIDGEIADDCWKDAAKVTDFVQVYPQPDEDAPNKTIVYICYDENNLYLAFECYTPKGEVYAKETVRDRNVSLGKDETVGLYLDANRDKKTCFLIFVTPLNVQTDGIVSKDGENMSLEWDGLWKSQSRKTSYGWSAEISIAFQSLDAEGTEFGINLLRLTFGSDGAPHVYTWCSSLAVPWKVSTFGILRRPEKIGAHKKSVHLSLIPYGSIAYSESEDWKNEVGIDARYKVLSELKGTITINPDYAQIEADVDEIDLSKTGIQLREKRPFFQNELFFFQTPISLFYTRSFSEIKYGTNLKYTKGGYSTNSYWVNSEEKNYFVLRTTKGLFKSSEIGGVVIDIENRENSNRLGSIDAHIAFPKNIWFYPQVCRNYRSKTNAYYLQIQRQPPFGLSFNLSRIYIEPDFDIEIGYIPFTDFVQNYTSLGYNYLTRNEFIPMIGLQIYYNHWEDTKGNLYRDEYQGFISSQLKGNITVGLGYNQEHRWYWEKYYDNKMGMISVFYDKGRNEVSLDYIRGDYYGANLDYLEGKIGLGFGPKITFALSGVYQYLRHNEESNDKDIIGVLKCNYRILPKLTWRTFLQWSDLSKEFDANFLLAYEFFTGSHIYLVWNETRDVSEFGIEERNLPLVDRGLFFKVCYQFGF